MGIFSLTYIPTRILILDSLKVLSLLGLDKIVTRGARPLEELRDEKWNGEILGFSTLPSSNQAKYGQPSCGVKRTSLNLALKDILIEQNIELREGWKLKSLIETEDKVVAISETGDRVEGSFLIGCDGIKSVIRDLILTQHGLSQGEADYTGLTQVTRFAKIYGGKI